MFPIMIYTIKKIEVREYILELVEIFLAITSKIHNNLKILTKFMKMW